MYIKLVEPLLPQRRGSRSRFIHFSISKTARGWYLRGRMVGRSTRTRSGAWRGAVDRGLRPPRSFPERMYGSTSPTRESATWPTCYSWKICSAPSGSSVGLASVGSSMRWRSGGRPALLVQWQRTAERRRLLVRLLRQQKDEKAKGQSRRGPPPRPRKRSQVLPARRSGLLLMPAVLLAPGSPVGSRDGVHPSGDLPCGGRGSRSAIAACAGLPPNGGRCPSFVLRRIADLLVLAQCSSSNEDYMQGTRPVSTVRSRMVGGSTRTRSGAWRGKGSEKPG